MKLLFLCRGNVGRSQIAEFLCKKKFEDKYEVSSAGVRLSGPEQTLEELLPHTVEVIQVMKEEGIDVSQARRKSVTENMVDAADKVVAIIEDEEILPEYISNSPKFIRWSMLDPKGKDRDFTRDVKNKIGELLDELDRNIG